MKKIIIPVSLFLIISVVFCLGFLNVNIAAENKISGELSKGYRIISVPEKTESIEYTVYRGDYLKFSLENNAKDQTLSIPSLSIKKKLTGNGGNSAPFFKMKNIGRYAFTIGRTRGYLNVIEYDGVQYQALTVAESAQMIDNISPVILDVRTQFEYANGHLQNTLLIPLQELQERVEELSEYKDENILIYCATGNRSTVAAKILIDYGFTRIYNMRDGLKAWTSQGLPIVH